MIITKDLVILNLPKTGSSFVRKVMKEIYFKRRNKNILTKGLHKLKIKKIGFKEVMAGHPTILNYKENWMFVHYDQMFGNAKISEIEKFLNCDLDYSFPEKSISRSTQNTVKSNKEIESIYKKLKKLSKY